MEIQFTLDFGLFPVVFDLIQCPECGQNLTGLRTWLRMQYPAPQHFRCSLCCHEWDKEMQHQVIVIED